MPWSTSNQIGQNAAELFLASTLKQPESFLNKLKACHWSIRVLLLETQQPEAVKNTTLVMSLSSIGHWGRHDTKYILFFDNILQAEFAVSCAT